MQTEPINPFARPKNAIAASEERPVKEEGRSTLEQEVLALTLLLKRAQPATFGPKWIRRHDYALYRRLEHRLKKTHGELDWSKMVFLLDKEWSSKWKKQHQREAGPLEQYVQELLKMLETKNPTHITPGWILNEDPNLYSRLVEKIRNRDARYQPDWDMVMGFLGEKWQKRWSQKRIVLRSPDEEHVFEPKPPREGKERRLQNDISDLVKSLEQKNPKKIGPGWLQINERNIYARAVRKIRTEASQLDWSLFSKQLPPQWQERWELTKDRQKMERPASVARTERKARTLEEDADAIQILLTKTNPPTFNARWIENHDTALYKRLCKILPSHATEGQRDWTPFLNLLDDKWRLRWTQRKPFEKKETSKDMRPRIERPAERTLEEDANLVQALLTRERPSVFSPSWIEQQDKNLYEGLRRKLPKGSDGQIIWNQLTNLLDEKWRLIWRYKQKSIEKHLPQNEYQNSEEVQAILDQHKKKLYTFLALLKPEDSQERDAICRELIHIAQQGNTLAADRLIELLMPLMHEWVDSDPALDVYKIKSEELITRLKKMYLLFSAGFFSQVHDISSIVH